MGILTDDMKRVVREQRLASVALRGFPFNSEGEIHDAIAARFHERGLDDLRSVVLIRVERARPLISPAYDGGRSEDNVRRQLSKYYDALNRPLVGS
jgi:hypothetical protein